MTEASLGRLGHRLADAALALPLRSLRLQLLRGEGRRRQVRPADAADARIGAGPGRRRRRERYGGFRGLDFPFDLGSFRGRSSRFFVFSSSSSRQALARSFALRSRSRSASASAAACRRLSDAALAVAASCSFWAAFALACCAFLASLAFLSDIARLSLLGLSLGLGDLFVRLGAREGSLGASLLDALVLGDLGRARLCEAYVSRGDGVE